MKIALLCESPVDEAAVKVLVETVLATPVQWISHKILVGRGGGFGAILKGISIAIRALHYNSEADAIVVVIDSDNTPIHGVTHLSEGEAARDCRVCEILTELDKFHRHLTPPQGPRLRLAVGQPVPCLEAWLLYGRDPHVGEAQWRRVVTEAGLKGRESTASFKKRLKQEVFGTDGPPPLDAGEVATRQARRVTTDLDGFELRFPSGFGLFRAKLRSWADGST